MDDADRILVDTLISIGLDTNKDDLTLEDFSPDILIAATSYCLEVIFENKNEMQSFPKSCPENMAARYKVGQILSEALKSLGYKDTIGYQSFLYPNVRDTRRIISFLVEQLPKDAGSTVQDGGNDSTRLNNIMKQSLEQNWTKPWLPHYCQNRDKDSARIWSRCLMINNEDDRCQLKDLSPWFDSFCSLRGQTNDFTELLSSVYEYDEKLHISQTIDVFRLRRQLIVLEKLIRSSESSKITGKIPPKIKKRTKFLRKEVDNHENSESDNAANDAVTNAEERLRKIQTVYEEFAANYDNILQKLKSINNEYEALQIKREKLKEEIDVQSKECAIKEKTGIVLMHGEENVTKLEAAISKKERQIENIEIQWKTNKEELINHMESLQQTQSDKYTKTKELEKYLRSVQEDMENCRRDYQEKDVQIKLFDERVKQILKNNPSQTKQNRNEFTKRILELTENKKKQNAEIRKILADIYQLQKDINSLRGKLERSFVETNDCIFANAKKDETSKKMYKVVVSIHENCQSLVEVIEEKGKLLREIRDLEMSVESENRENIERNLEKISADYSEVRSNCDNLKIKIKQCKQTIK